jgi:hypothetical protein
MNIGTWVRDNFPPGTPIGAGQSGAVEYFADNQKVINLDGVVNKAFYESCKLKKGIEYIKGKKIEYVVDWLCYIEFIEFVSANLKEGDLIYLETINSFQNGDSKWLVYRVKN